MRFDADPESCTPIDLIVWILTGIPPIAECEGEFEDE